MKRTNSAKFQHKHSLFSHTDLGINVHHHNDFVVVWIYNRMNLSIASCTDAVILLAIKVVSEELRQPRLPEGHNDRALTRL